MTGEMIKSFLVGLGFGVDESDLAKFNKAIASASLRVTALYASIKVAAAGIFWSISKISEGFEQMGYEYRIIAPAINKAIILRQALLSAYRAAGINIEKVVQQSVLFNYSLAKTKFALEAIYKSVGAKFLPILTKQMDVFRAKIYTNMPKIQSALERMVKFIFKAFEATVILGERLWSILGRVYEFFVKLDESTNGWSTRIIALVAAWKLLNLSFLATPIGVILGGLVALLALFDDFKTWQEGGESLFDWSAVVPIINLVKDAVSSLVDSWRGFVDAILDSVLAVRQLVSGDFTGFLESVKRIVSDLIGMFHNLGAIIDKAFLAFGGISNLALDKISSIFGGGNAVPALNTVLQPSPLLPQNSGVSQRVNQETNITVQGSANATQTGEAVASQQRRVNFDLTRNLKGATQ